MATSPAGQRSMTWRRRKASTSCGKKQRTLGHYFGLSACENSFTNVGKKKSLRLSLEKRNQLDSGKDNGTHVATKRKSFSVQQQCICKSEKMKDSGPSGKKSFRLSLRKREQCVSNIVSQGCSESKNLCRKSEDTSTGKENCMPEDIISQEMTDGYSFSQKLTLSDLENFIATPRDTQSLISQGPPELTRPKSPLPTDDQSVLLFSLPSWLSGSPMVEPAHSAAAQTHVDGPGNCKSEHSFNECSFRGDDWSKYLNDSRMDAMSGDRINRYLVLDVISQTFVDVKDARRRELVLRLREERLKIEKLCRLRDDWLGTDVAPGDIVQVNAAYDVDRNCYIVDSAADASIIVEPDTLLTASSIANSFACARKSVFADKFKGSTANKAMVFGQMLHKIFQATLSKCQEVGVALRPEVLREVVMEELRSTLTSLEFLDQLYGLDVSEEKALEELTEYVPAVVEWCCNFLCSEPHQGAGDIEFERAGDSVKKCSVCVTDVVDIEENIWSPRFGLKGKVDVSVTLKEKRGAGEVVVTKRMPLELKTGKMHHSRGTNEHRAQVILYGLMMSDRYPNQPQHGGLLLYLKEKHMQGLPFNAQDKRGLLMARNDLARYIGGHSVSLPAVVKDQHFCKYCPYLKQCSLCQRSLENSTEDLGELFSAQISHLATSHLEFFAQWFGLLAEEEQFCRATGSRAPWLSSAHEREREGLGLADMLAQPPTFFKSTGRYLQSFTKKLDAIPSSSVRAVSLSTNDRVVISAQDGTGWAIAMGSVTEVLPGGGVRVALDKAVPFEADGVLYRIDQMSSSGAGGIAYSNLADMCTSDSEREHRLRELIIDGSAPVFGPDVHVSDESLIALNSNQKAVIRKVLVARDYTLVHGMPGTGKTTTIAHLVQTLVSRGKTILLTSYTHSAVDSILLKLVKIGVPFMRLGPPSRIHPSLQSATPIHLCQDVGSVKQLEQFYDSQSVVATTCLAVASHPVCARRVFDVCIVDEASQITLPNVLGPLRHAHTFVLVGDHYQLPPLVRSQKAREGGLAVSLFQKLSEGHPAALISLEKQYRMNREIMAVCNSLVYGGRLQCGSDEVATGCLQLPFYPSQQSGVEGWMDKVLNPQSPVWFLDTDGCTHSAESCVGGHICNEFEAKLVAKLVVKLTMYGLPAKEIGIITPLRYQQVIIKEAINATCSNGDHTPSLLEVDTVDKYQGRDKDCIIVSLVRSNREGSTGTVLLDWRRINVAITRAKCKLLLIGSCSTLKHAQFLQQLLNLLAKQKQITSIPTFAGCS